MVTTNKLFLLTLTLFAGMLNACNAKSNETQTEMNSNEPATTVATEPAGEPGKWKKEPGLYAEIVTAKGNMVIALEYKKVPVTVANFVGLAEGKIKNSAKADGVPYFDGLTFHRCIHTPQPFMIQGGDPQGTGMGGTGYAFKDEFDLSLKFDKPGLLAMANSGPNTNSSQFFITEGITSWLDYKHTIFGTVVEGFSAVPAINNGEPMTKVNIIRVGKDAEAFDAVAVWAKKDELLAAKAAEFAKQKADKDKAKLVSIEELVKTKFPKAQKTASGLYYIIEQKGTGAMPVAGKNVSVHYTGTLADGTKFDSSRDRNQPFSFGLGQNQVIKGWDEGVALMPVGSKGKLIIPPGLGYGANGAGGVIPGNACLVFDIEVLGIQ
ncbi:MAG: peptidylprolyl isomerase [Chitinophagales bacterium]|nr:peptidylprolyl isomerase [Chitinophagales bacterium]